MYWRLVILASTLLLQSCALFKQEEPPEAPPAPPPVVVIPEPKRAAMEVVILVSEDTPAYSKVAKALSMQLGQRSSIRYLGGSQLENVRMLDAYKNDERKQFVSIGLNASVAAKSLVNRQVIFCQVFNYQDYGLLTSRHKGVSMIPSLSKTFTAWRALSPATADVGVISGPGFEGMMQVASSVARSQGIALHYEIVNSDKEYQYAYKQMADKVQGYWLLPDNRVLSENVLRDVMTFSVRNSKQVVVFSDELLNLGGLFSVTSDYRNIVQLVLDRLEKAQGKEDVPGPDIVYLDRAILTINPVMAQRLNLEIPEHYKKYAKGR
ncbi:MAG TPA: ABC transporter substrate binding protein [Gallionellaceae bacterium]